MSRITMTPPLSLAKLRISERIRDFGYATAAVLLLLVWPFSLTFGLAFLTGIPWWGAAAVAFLTFSLVRSILFGPLYRCGRCHKRSYLSYALAVVVVGLGGAGLWLAVTSLWIGGILPL